jgi:hypothetical protein
MPIVMATPVFYTLGRDEFPECLRRNNRCCVATALQQLFMLRV